MNKIGYYLFIISVVLLSACNKEAKIEGTSLIGDLGSLNDTLYFYGTDRFYDRQDTIVLSGGKLVHQLELDTTILGYIYSDRFKETRVFISPDDQLILSLSASDSTLLEISGNKMHTEYNQLAQTLQSSPDTIKAIKDHIKSNPFSLTNIAAIEDFLLYTDSPRYDKIEDIIKELPGSLRDRQAIEAINNKLVMVQRAREGRSLLFFNLPDMKGKFHDRKDFKNKLLVLYFWASWDEGSKQMNKELRTLYKKFNKRKKDLAIVGISIDADTTQLKNTIKTDTLSWTILSDPTGWDSQVIDRYGITKLPTLFFVDRTDIIVARDVSIDSLKTLIEYELKNK